MTQETMREIRREADVVRSMIRRAGNADRKYVTLHRWGCGCCFTIVKETDAPRGTGKRRRAKARRKG
jgi:hypothetical protein